MKRLEEHMSFYEAYHKNKWNKLTHFLGIPAIIYSILIPMAWARFSVADVQLSLAMVFSAGVLIYYFRLNTVLAATFTVFMLPLIYLAEQAGRLPLNEGLMLFLSFFVGGWILQLIGHVFEKRRPAFTKNLFQLIIGPFFLMTEVFFMLGIFKEKQAEIEERSKQFM